MKLYLMQVDSVKQALREDFLYLTEKLLKKTIPHANKQLQDTLTKYFLENYVSDLLKEKMRKSNNRAVFQDIQSTISSGRPKYLKLLNAFEDKIRFFQLDQQYNSMLLTLILDVGRHPRESEEWRTHTRKRMLSILLYVHWNEQERREEFQSLFEMWKVAYPDNPLPQRQFKNQKIHTFDQKNMYSNSQSFEEDSFYNQKQNQGEAKQLQNNPPPQIIKRIKTSNSGSPPKDIQVSSTDPTNLHKFKIHPANPGAGINGQANLHDQTNIRILNNLFPPPVNKFILNSGSTEFPTNLNTNIIGIGSKTVVNKLKHKPEQTYNENPSQQLQHNPLFFQNQNQQLQQQQQQQLQQQQQQQKQQQQYQQQQQQQDQQQQQQYQQYPKKYFPNSAYNYQLNGGTREFLIPQSTNGINTPDRPLRLSNNPIKQEQADDILYLHPNDNLAYIFGTEGNQINMNQCYDNSIIPNSSGILLSNGRGLPGQNTLLSPINGQNHPTYFQNTVGGGVGGGAGAGAPQSQYYTSDFACSGPSPVKNSSYDSHNNYNTMQQLHPLQQVHPTHQSHSKTPDGSSYNFHLNEKGLENLMMDSSYNNEIFLSNNHSMNQYNPTVSHFNPSTVSSLQTMQMHSQSTATTNNNLTSLPGANGTGKIKKLQTDNEPSSPRIPGSSIQPSEEIASHFSLAKLEQQWQTSQDQSQQQMKQSILNSAEFASQKLFQSTVNDHLPLFFKYNFNMGSSGNNLTNLQSYNTSNQPSNLYQGASQLAGSTEVSNFFLYYYSEQKEEFDWEVSVPMPLYVAKTQITQNLEQLFSAKNSKQNIPTSNTKNNNTQNANNNNNNNKIINNQTLSREKDDGQFSEIVDSYEVEDNPISEGL